jgi:hypothetical protein
VGEQAQADGALVDVGDAEAAADVEEVARGSETALDQRGEVGQPVDGSEIGVGRQDLRPDVGVEAAKTQAARLQHRLDGLLRVRRLQPELRVGRPGHDVRVSARGDVGDDTHEHVLARAESRGDRLGARDLVQVVADKQPDTRADGTPELLLGLVVAVQGDLRRRDAGPQTGLELAARGGQELQPLAGHESQQPSCGEGLDGV